MQLLSAWSLLGVSGLFAAALLIVAAQEQREHRIRLFGEDGKIHLHSLLYDFEHYKERFSKVYSDSLEHTVRRHYFMARAYRVAVSVVKYIYKHETYHFALNHLSDATPQELESMMNHVKPGQAQQRSDISVVKLEAQAGSDETASRTLTRLPTQHSASERGSGQEEQTTGGSSAPDMRKEVAERDYKSHEWPVDSLFSTGENVKLDPEVEAKLAIKVASNNAKYQPLEPASPGKAKQLQQVDWEELMPHSEASHTEAASEAHGIAGRIAHFVHSLFHKESSPDQEHLHDEVFLDLRTSSKCFSLPRDQGKCGSCYAFAMIAIMEWLYCMQTGKLVLFSEQYIIDCGNGNLDYLYGCVGGAALENAQFVINYGLELLSDHPYRAANGTCEYKNDRDISTTGFIRPTDALKRIGFAETKDFGDYLKYGPVYADIMVPDGFMEYKRGVYGMGCKKDTAHAVAIIGHGRENGREYWLIRNSMGPGWGEDGYYKLDKAANCIHSDGVYFLTYFPMLAKEKKIFNDPSPYWAPELDTLLHPEKYASQ